MSLDINEHILREIESVALLGIYEMDLAQDSWTRSRALNLLLRMPDVSSSTEGFFQIIHPDDREPIRQAFQDALSNGGSFQARFRCHADGAEMYVENRARIYRESGRATSVLGIIQDISDQQTVNATFEASPSGMILVDESHRIVLVNRQTEKIFGYSRQELAGKKLDILIPENIRPHHTDYVKEYMKDPRSREMGRGRDLHGRRKEGSLVPVEVGLHPVFFSRKRYVICSVVDITERKELPERLIRRNQELKTFAYRLAHDIRSPLTNLVNILSLHKADQKLMSGEEAMQFVSDISRDLLQFTDEIIRSTLEEQAELEKQPVDLQDVQRRMLSRFQFQLQERGMQLNWQMNHRTIPALPRGVMEEILGNLLSNSIKYSNPSRPQAMVRTFNEDQWFVLEVEDNGPGIPKEKQKDVFSLFTRFHREKDQGSGLGLYLVKDNLDRLGGQIDFESNEQGTTFRVRLPLRDA